MASATETRPQRSMAEAQGATPPPWLGRPWWRLLVDVVGGVRQNWEKVVQVVSLLTAFFRPALIRRRLERLRDLGHIDVSPLPTVAQLLVAGRDQMMVSAAEETKIFYRAQGIPWGFHNLRRFISGPATMLDPIGLFSPRDAIVHHVLQTFHRHPLYDFVLLRAHEGGIESMDRQSREIEAGVHLHQRALTSLIEDGSYHARLRTEIVAFEADPQVAAREIPAKLVDDPHMMLAMDQFKDMRGYTRYAARLRVGMAGAIAAWLMAGFDETVGQALGVKLGPRRVHLEACDPDIVARHPGA